MEKRPYIPQPEPEPQPSSSSRAQDGTFVLAKPRIGLTINGIRVDFPYRPYPVQRDYMAAVISSCEDHKNALLESPTGTGKTLALLCASLSWVRDYKERHQGAVVVPKILYMSRTHAQLAQVIKELKKISEETRQSVRVVTIGSRDQLCINRDIKSKCSGTNLNRMCMQLRKNKEKEKKCPYYRGAKKAFGELLGDKICNVEELRKLGEECGRCPYFGAKEAAHSAGLVLMPYNYLLDERIAKNLKEDFSGAIMIFDEAHNVTHCIEDSTSLAVTLHGLERCQDDIKKVKRLKQTKQLFGKMADLNAVSEADIESVGKPIDLFYKFLSSIKDLSEAGIEYEGYEMPEILSQATDGAISEGNYETYLKRLEQITDVLVNVSEGKALQEWGENVEKIFCMGRAEASRPAAEQGTIVSDYKVVIYKDKDWGSRKDEPCLKAFNLNPGLGFNDLLATKPHCVILTSGTLSPLAALENELQTEFPIKLETLHVIEKSQVSVQVVSQDSSEEDFKFDFASRSNSRQLESLVDFVKSICETTPGGVLVFFASYLVMDKFFTGLRTTGLAETIAGKSVFQEQRKSAENDSMLKRYRETIAGGRGAVLVGVARGKISEGLDFADDCARAVIFVGIPYSPAIDKKILYKRQYLDAVNSKVEFKGRAWYSLEAVRAVNQAVGRVIRSKDDYGAIILVDTRYKQSNITSLLSKWIREAGISMTNTVGAIKNLAAFFASQKRQPAVPCSSGSSDKPLRPDQDGTSTKEKEKKENSVSPQLQKETVIIVPLHALTEGSSICNASTIESKPAASPAGSTTVSPAAVSHPEEDDKEEEIVAKKKCAMAEFVGEERFDSLEQITQRKDAERMAEEVFALFAGMVLDPGRKEKALELLRQTRDLVSDRGLQVEFAARIEGIIVSSCGGETPGVSSGRKAK